MLVRVHWYDPDEHPDLWKLCRGLYLYGHPEEDEILYIGKVDGTTVRRRWNRGAKRGFWEALEADRNLHEHTLLAGVIELEAGNHLSRAMICDIESLLINRIQPWGNIQCRNTRIMRAGLSVLCEGEWSYAPNFFRE